jgi:hypothetical protein
MTRHEDRETWSNGASARMTGRQRLIVFLLLGTGFIEQHAGSNVR